MDDAWIGFLNLFLVVFLVLLNGFFVASEFAMVKIRDTRIQQLINEGNRRARFARKLTDELDVYLSACQLGITLSSLGLGWLGEPAVARVIEPLFRSWGFPPALIHTLSFAIAFGLITSLHIVIGELAPKSMAIRRAEGTVLWTAVPMVWFKRLMYPFIWLLNGLANRLLRFIGIDPVVEHQSAHTEEEIRILMNASHESGLISQTEYNLVDNAFEFAETLAREVMVPRTEMICLDIQWSFVDILWLVQQEKYTRYPVCDREKDNIVGLVHIKDFYELVLQGKQDLAPVIREVVSVPESMRISAVFNLLQHQKAQMAIVVDEYGGTAGLLTIEDILEELVGEIKDEFDDDPPEVEKWENGYLVNGRVLLEDVQELLPVNLSAEGIDTLAGWILLKIRKIPSIGDKISWEGWNFEIREMGGKGIKRVWIYNEENQPIESFSLAKAEQGN